MIALSLNEMKKAAYLAGAASHKGNAAQTYCFIIRTNCTGIPSS